MFVIHFFHKKVRIGTCLQWCDLELFVWALYLCQTKTNWTSFVCDFGNWWCTKHWATLWHHKATSKYSYRCFTMEHVLLILLKSNRLILHSMCNILWRERLGVHYQLRKGIVTPLQPCYNLETGCSKAVCVFFFCTGFSSVNLILIQIQTRCNCLLLFGKVTRYNHCFLICQRKSWVWRNLRCSTSTSGNCS